MAAALKVASTDTQVTTIGPEWGSNITNAALLALAVSILAILALHLDPLRVQDGGHRRGRAGARRVIITLGIYALLGREVTPNTVAALLTILGYSLYDTIVVFHRIRENTQNLSKKTFMEMANDSLNQVLARWVNTGLSSLIPVVCLLLFGGDHAEGLRVRAHHRPRSPARTRRWPWRARCTRCGRSASRATWRCARSSRRPSRAPLQALDPRARHAAKRAGPVC